MLSYSRWLARSLSVIVAAVALSLAAAAYWQQKIQQGNETIFQPVARIEQAKQILQQIELLRPGLTPNKNESTLDVGLEASEQKIANCTLRQQAVLQGRLILALGISRQQSAQLLQSAAANSGEINGVSVRCDGIGQALSAALKLSQSRGPESQDETVWLTQSLTENLIWNRSLPCIEASPNEHRILLVGNPLKCGIDVDWIGSEALPLSGSLRQMNSRIAASSTTAALAGQFEANGLVQVTLDHSLQQRLDRWSECLESKTPCDQVPLQVPAKAATIVAIDAERGDILALWCHGPSCKEGERANMGHMAALLFEAPPASTTKLIHALAIARNAAVSPGMLELQIKTSGQNDGAVSKRNEWWERQVICNPTENPAGLQHSETRTRCDVMHQVRRIADEFGFNAFCTQTPRGINLNCGRSSLAGNASQLWLPAQLGRIASEAPARPTTTMAWSTYEAIRQGRIRPIYGPDYEATSYAVQSVLGAGSARISPLGLANLSTRVWRQADGRAAVYPRIVRPSNIGSPVTAKPAETNPRARSTASIVLAGMRKVVEPAQSGWQGSGTASTAVKLAFGQPCSGNCGLWAKTGTVSRADPFWAGTTLLTALVNTNELEQWTGRSLAMLPNRRIALGVIVQPSDSLTAGAAGHAASQLGMLLVSELFNP